MMRGWIHWFDRIQAFDISKPRAELQMSTIASPVLLTSIPLLQISALSAIEQRNHPCEAVRYIIKQIAPLRLSEF
jgi:hypothetical protein